MTIVLMALPEEEPVVVVAADEEGVLPPPPPDDPPVVALPEPDDPPPEDPPELLAPPPQPASARAKIRTSAANASVPFIVPSLLAEAVESAQTIILATPKLAERDGSGRHDSQLLHHGKVVPHRPVLRHLALDHAEPVRLLGGGDAPARGRDTHQLALVRADHRTPHRHRLPVGAESSISKRWSGKTESSRSQMCLAPPGWYAAVVAAWFMYWGEMSPSMASRPCWFQTSSM